MPSPRLVALVVSGRTCSCNLNLPYRRRTFGQRGQRPFALFSGKPKRSGKRPHDLNSLAASIVEDATDEAPEPEPAKRERDPAGVALGTRGGEGSCREDDRRRKTPGAQLALTPPLET